MSRVRVHNTSQFKLSFMATALAFAVASGGAMAAQNIEQAPRLTNEDFGAEAYPNDYALSVSVGEASFFPSGGIRLTRIDNLYYEKDAIPTESVQLRVIPKFDLVAEGSKSLFWLLLRGNLKKHEGDGSNADANDFRLRGFAHLDLSNRHRIDAEISVAQLSEELGTGRTRESSSSGVDLQTEATDVYSLNRIGLNFSYGNPRSRGELVVGAAVGTLGYDKDTAELKRLERDMQILWGKFSYKLTGKTTLYSRISHRNFDYKSSDRDRVINNIRFGVLWKATGLLYGDASVTKTAWDYENNASKDDDALELAANLYWAIRSYSTASIYVREFRDDDVNGSDEIQETFTVGASWKHGWTDRVNTTVSAYFSEDSLKDATVAEREVVSLEGRVALRRWLNFLLGVSNDRLNSNSVESDRQLVYLGLEGNL